MFKHMVLTLLIIHLNSPISLGMQQGISIKLLKIFECLVYQYLFPQGKYNYTWNDRTHL